MNTEFLSGLFAGVVGTGIVSVAWVFIINKVILSDPMLDYLGRHTDDIVDNIERKDKSVGEALRARVIKLCEDIIADLKAPN